MQTHTGLLIALCILISMLLICHTMNFLFTHKRNSSSFYNIPSITRPLPTQYNLITYDDNLGKIPCDSQAQIPCNVIQKQCTNQPTKYTLSDSELALLYKEAYEMAGEEVLLRTLNEMQTPSTTNPTPPNTSTLPITTNPTTTRPTTTRPTTTRPITANPITIRLITTRPTTTMATI